MADVTEIRLPGVGVRHEFTTSTGERVGVLAHRSGRHELFVYDREDADICTAVLHLSPEDTTTLAELLGAPRVSAALEEVQQRVEGLAIEWLTIPEESSVAGTTIGDGQFRTRTGTSIVAVIRDGRTITAPGPEAELLGGDVAVVVGTPEGLAQLRELIE